MHLGWEVSIVHTAQLREFEPNFKRQKSRIESLPSATNWT